MTDAVAEIENRRGDLETLSQTDLPVASVAETLLEIADREVKE